MEPSPPCERHIGRAGSWQDGSSLRLIGEWQEDRETEAISGLDKAFSTLRNVFEDSHRARLDALGKMVAMGPCSGWRVR